MDLRAGFLIVTTALILGVGCGKERLRTVYVTVPAPATPAVALTPSPVHRQVAQPIQLPSPLPVRQPVQASGLTQPDIEYLRWFQVFEKKRVQMIERQEAQFCNSAVRSVQGIQEFGAMSNQATLEWKRVARLFQSSIPPPKCRAVAVAYLRLLNMSATIIEETSWPPQLVLRELNRLKLTGVFPNYPPHPLTNEYIRAGVEQIGGKRIPLARNRVNAAMRQCLGKASASLPSDLAGFQIQ